MSRQPLLGTGETVDVRTSHHSDGNAANGQRLRRIYETLVAKAPTFGARVAESLDYEPVQNNLYFERLRARVGVKRYYGCDCGNPHQKCLSKALVPFIVSIRRSTCLGLGFRSG
jgi:hypothetical protein